MMLVIRKGADSQILQHLRVPETLCIIDLRRVQVVNVINPRIASRRLQKCLEALHRARCPIQVGRVACHPPRVEI